ncbi:hydroxymethylglutaryl-CoA reductase, degradative [Flavobacteriaceae bacterium]|jgi:hydroxymethylglutaryl-CoA reductase|nr:hydroxymethylglutaryl-CoA reductase, degradative [Flavobacteriaceae bacterium]MDC1195385.1 hydroxymethylglutaryl-CoA reductase, degradative [Flavobacteriaceae bacterium]MDG1384320.1 hydroxymethylglutaryl-CoA reductase, degradative [Flavobacteriaceae bacterium]
MENSVSGFSKFTKAEKIDWLISNHFQNNPKAKANLERYWNTDDSLQKLHDEFTENTISNFYLPFGVAPNFLINNKIHVLPMTIEESSVVAAASNAAKFWMERGGFTAEVLSTTKVGQVHFIYSGEFFELESIFNNIKPTLFDATKGITKNMEARGGGIFDIALVNKTSKLSDYYQLHVTFETMDAMGANFINSCLEQIATTFKTGSDDIQVVMSILSNYVPDCLVRAEVRCKVEELTTEAYSGQEFADTFIQAVRIAEVEPYRAVTHNKGIMNGVDSVVLATGNDFRAVEAGVHAYAARSGSYSSLTHASIENGVFKFWIELPLALGTVGGLTGLHPLVKTALELLGNPSAKELMEIVAVAGLAQNFAALKSLTTTGIQQGHMKMHLLNILNQFEANDSEKQQLIEHFKTHNVTHSAVVDAIENLRA